MKIDGTYTVQELLNICNEQLQSWERKELAEKLTYDEPEGADIEDFDTNDLITELEDRFHWRTITKNDKERLERMIENVNVLE